MALSKGTRAKKTTKKKAGSSKKKSSKKKTSGASKKASKKKKAAKKASRKATKKASKKALKKAVVKAVKAVKKAVVKAVKKASKKKKATAKKASKPAAKKASPAVVAPEAAPEVSKASKAKRSSAKAASVGKSKPVARPAEPEAPLAVAPEETSVESPSDPDALPDDGDPLPGFQLRDQTGAELSLQGLLGAPFVLYFYPKDDTPGCTTEACTFNSELEPFEKLGVRVIGVSPDSTQSHAKFSSKYDLKFTLLSDPKHALSKALGVYAKKQNYGREYMGIVRSTFLVDAQGVIRGSWRGVRVAGHVPQVLAAAARL